MLGQVGAQHIDHEGRRLVGGEHGNERPLTHRQKRLRCLLPIRQHQHRRLQSHDTGNTPGTIFGRRTGDVGHLALAQNLNPIGMDVIEVADQICTRTGGSHSHFVKTPLRGS